MIISLEINGQRYINFLSAQVNLSIEDLCNTFSFSTSPEGSKQIPVRIKDECSVYVDGELVTTGYVEKITGSGDSSSHIISISGRDKTSDIVDSRINVLDDLNGDLTLKEVAERVISHIESSLDVKDLTDGAKFNAVDMGIAPEPGENCFDFLEKLAKRQSALLTSDSSGNLVLYKYSPESVNSPLVNRVNDSGSNNIISYNFKFDNSKRYFFYAVKSNRSLSSLFFSVKQNANLSVDVQGDVIDKDIQNGRQYVVTGENAGTTSQQVERAEWERDIRASRSRTYSCVVPGFRNQEGGIWQTNMLVKVVDEHADISDSLLVNSVQFSYGQQGALTSLGLVNKDSYTREAEGEKYSKAKKGLLSNVFSSTPTSDD